MHPLIAVAVLALSAAPEASPIPVQPNARAFTLESASVTGAAVLRTGDHVDIIAVLKDDKGLSAVTLLQNVVVVAHAAPGAGEPKQLSLLLIPEEAELLALAKVNGQLVATLRNPADVNVLEERGVVTVRNALTGERPTPPKPAKK